MRRRFGQRGLTLLETVVSIALFVLIVLAIYQLYTRMLVVIQTLRVRTVATNMANEQFEIARNLTYEDVGTIGGIPNGVLEPSQTIEREGMTFGVTTTVRNIDDPFDGTLGNGDLSPADSRLFEVEIDCTSCDEFTPIIYTGRIAPKNLETASTNGALVLQVFDAGGQPISGADLSIVNNDVTPVVNINDTTGADGTLTIVDAIPSVESYQLTATKSGYTTEQTYLPGEVGNPNPTKPHATVAQQQITQVSFAIDQVSEIDFTSLDQTCSAVGDIDFDLQGSKLIGTSPDVYKYQQSHTTGAGGGLLLEDLEWDTYTLTLTDSTHELVGSNPITPFELNPNGSLAMQLVVQPNDQPSFHVVVKDIATGLPISDASVTIERGATTIEQFTDRGSISQTDWTNGSGQADFVDEARFWAETNIDYTTTPDQIVLDQAFGDYLEDGDLTSSSFDIGSTGNFHQILWEPQTQPPDAGPDAVRFQIATNTDNTTWNYLGPDGTGATYYTLADQNINPVHNGDQYMRYKAYLHTDDDDVTPVITDISFVFTSDCVPPGQTIFTNLGSGLYDVDVTHPSYEDVSTTHTITSGWDSLTIEMDVPDI